MDKRNCRGVTNNLYCSKEKKEEINNPAHGLNLLKLIKWEYLPA